MAVNVAVAVTTEVGTYERSSGHTSTGTDLREGYRDREVTAVCGMGPFLAQGSIRERTEGSTCLVQRFVISGYT